MPGAPKALVASDRSLLHQAFGTQVGINTFTPFQPVHVNLPVPWSV